MPTTTGIQLVRVEGKQLWQNCCLMNGLVCLSISHIIHEGMLISSKKPYKGQSSKVFELTLQKKMRKGFSSLLMALTNNILLISAVLVCLRRAQI